ncbi:MAG: hypothetical protein QOJ12_1100 [Thermoleophilales bacterium]|nr:hypothetical protein [Thermoleophilales bacterium]
MALFIFMLFPWYKVSVKGLGGGQSQSGNAWQSLGPGDLFLLLLILIVIGCVVVRALGAEANVPVPLSTVMLAAGALATLYILWRIVSLPGALGDAKDQLNALGKIGGVSVSVGRGFGIFLAFLAAIGIAVGSFLSARERGEAVPGVDGGLGGFGGASGGGGPLGAGQPAATPTATPAGVGAPAAGVPDPGAAAAGGPKADWYPDPQGQARLRYWDGSQWTDQTAD